MATPAPVRLTSGEGRRIWLRAQRLDTRAPFGAGPGAVVDAVSHLGYVQIDTIHVIERCHHHILATRIPEYRRDDLRHAQAVDKSVFEYWTHALAYVPTADFRFFVPIMKRHRRNPARWFSRVDPKDLRRVTSMLKREGALSIRDIEDDVLVDRGHPWGSRKPSKWALQLAFFNGTVTVSERLGMVKTYELTNRHFGWKTPPRGVTEREKVAYLVERALRSQGVVSVDSICHGLRNRRVDVSRVLATMTRRGELVPVRLEGADDVPHWIRPEALGSASPLAEPLVHILSPFDPLIIQRERLERFFGYRHVFEAYLPPAKRQFGYFALPVLVDDRIAAAIDIKTDRERGKLLLQKWTWVGKRVKGDRARIDEALDRFERFQLGT